MALDFEHRGDHVAVNLSGDLTVEAVLALVRLIDSLLDTYFYTRVDLTISSHGGSTHAANAYLSALPRWEARGVVLRTRVCTHASSLAALFYSLGDERVADPHARLLYHCARVSEAADITAADTVQMRAVLTQLDNRFVTLLVDRALRAGPISIPALPHTSDRALVLVLVQRLSLAGEGASHKARVRALARYVRRAIRNRSRGALKRLYRAVLREARSISPYLACTLGLADRVEEPELPPGGAPSVFEVPVSGLVVPEWRALYPPFGAVPRSAITRHVFALGETGSGKTMSAVLPVVAAMARAPEDHVRGALLIDPKRELAPVVRTLAGERLQELPPEDLVVDLMEPDPWRLDDDLRAKRWGTAAMKIMLRMRGFAPASPLRVLGPHSPGGSNSEFFDREGCSLLRDVLAFILMILDPDAPPISEWLPPVPRVFYPGVEEGASEPADGPEAGAGQRGRLLDLSNPSAWVLALLQRAMGQNGERGVNVVALASWALGTPLVQVAPGPKESPWMWAEGEHAHEETPWLWAQLAAAAMSVFGADAGEGRDLLQRIRAYWRKSAQVRAQHMGVVASARNATHDFSAPSVARSVYFGCEPGLLLEGAARVDFPALVSCGPSAPSAPRIVLYQPSRDGADALVAACLKARFFESVFLDVDRQSGRDDLPLVGYVADEAHRYLTSDAVHGEASFLDSARSFGCVAVLATQSLASVEHALAQGGGSATERRAALEVVWTNTATKLAFRSTDERTAARVQELTPYRPGHAPITRVRPLSALPPGSAYCFLPDGSFRIAQLDPFDVDAPARERSTALVPVSGVPEERRRKRRKAKGRKRRSASKRSIDVDRGRAREEVSP